MKMLNLHMQQDNSLKNSIRAGLYTLHHRQEQRLDLDTTMPL